MKKILLRVLAATLVCSASLFTACSVANDDNAAGVTPVQRLVVFPHLPAERQARHQGNHHDDGHEDRSQAQKPHPPVKQEHQDGQPGHRGIHAGLIRELVSQLSFRGLGGFLHPFAYLSLPASGAIPPFIAIYPAHPKQIIQTSDKIGHFKFTDGLPFLSKLLN